MNTNYSENNHLVLVGKVVSEKAYSHEIYGEKFYLFNLEVVRLSSTTDIIPITISERLLRRMCPKCKKARPFTDKEREIIQNIGNKSSEDI